MESQQTQCRDESEVDEYIRQWRSSRRDWSPMNRAEKVALQELVALVIVSERHGNAALIPEKGSGAWAIMQHLAGETLHYNGWPTDCLWLPENTSPPWTPDGLMDTAGWVVIEPKPLETFDFLEALRRAKAGKCVQGVGDNDWTLNFEDHQFLLTMNGMGTKSAPAILPDYLDSRWREVP